MYPYEDRVRAVELFNTLGKPVRATPRLTGDQAQLESTHSPVSAGECHPLGSPRSIADAAGRRLGSLLLADAIQRPYASAETIGSSMVVVDALHERAAAFYQSFGFQPLPESPRLVLPMLSIEELLAR
ncbi:MAG: GNAT family N-acetyltransferase [Pseudomonadota bacterium]|nr:GNAT family N-acetyltransferase [Pseudomonadota bacterium]